MTYPSGVQLATLTFSNPSTFLGNEATRTELTVQSTSGVVWSATGQPIDNFEEVMNPGAGMPGSLTVPFVDQAGFTDQAGNVFSMWAYVVTRKTFFGTGKPLTVRKNWQPVLGQSEVDFDNLPGGTIGLPVSAPQVPVTSVASLTGSVGAEALAGALGPLMPAPDVSGKQDVSTLDAAVAAKATTDGTALKTALNATFVPKWKTATAYLAGDKVLSPTGDVVSSIADHTSGASFTPANWNLSPSYVDKVSAPTSFPNWKASGNRVAFLGDSTTISHYGANMDAWPDYAAILSNQRIRYTVNAGVSGNTSAQMLARIQADVIAKAPNVCIVDAGINDLGMSVPFATFKANIAEIVRLLRTAGIAPVLTTILPQGNTALKLPYITTWNLWLKLYAESQGIPILDFYPITVDPATGTYRAGMDSGDGVHPSTLGYYTMGKYVADTLGPLLPVYSPPLAQAQSTYDTANLAPSPMFLTGTAGTPTGWVAVGSPTGTVNRTLVTDAAINGQWAQFAVAGTNGTCGIGKVWNPAAGTIDPGDKLLIMARIASDTVSAGGGAFFDVIVNGSVVIGVTLRAAIPGGIILREYTAPATVTSVQVDFKALAGTGNVRFAQPTIFNLTKLGLS